MAVSRHKSDRDPNFPIQIFEILTANWRDIGGGSDMIIPHNFFDKCATGPEKKKIDHCSLGTALEYLKFQMTSANA